MLLSAWLWGSLSLFGSLADASKAGNYSVQLLAGLTPKGWSSKDWAAAADTMIGKTQAYVGITFPLGPCSLISIDFNRLD